MVINDYNISSYGDSSSFYISDVNSVLSNVVNHKNDIILMLDSIDSRHVLNLNTSICFTSAFFYDKINMNWKWLYVY